MSSYLESGFKSNWHQDFEYNQEQITSIEMKTISRGFVDVIETLRFGNHNY